MSISDKYIQLEQSLYPRMITLSFQSSDGRDKRKMKGVHEKGYGVEIP